MKALDLYWKSDPDWYDYADDEVGTPYLTENAPDEAIGSFAHYLEQKKRMQQIHELDKYVENGVYCVEPSDRDLTEFKKHAAKRKYPGIEFAKFAEYVIYYPDEDDPDFDGEHYGGIKGLSDDAPEDAKYAFRKYMYEYYEAQRFNRKI